MAAVDTLHNLYFRDKLQEFMAATQLSYAQASRVLDVSAGTMGRWFREGEDRCDPSRHIMVAVERKIDALNAAHEQEGIYNSLHGLRPHQRAEALINILHNL